MAENDIELGYSPDAMAERRAQLLALLRQTSPEVISDNQIAIEKLKELIGQDHIAPAEHYELSWAGKAAARREIQKTTSHTLLPAASNPPQAPHMLIEGENLEVLRSLQKSYHGKVKMIYIDPPYNTGSDSFVYPDDYSETLNEYQKRTGEKNEAGYLNKQSLWKKNSKESGQYHSAWLSMMYPRLYLARNLLRDDGVIFISIDDHESSNLKLICDEVFGGDNFIDTIAVELSTTSGPKTVNAQQGTIVKNVEFVHIYRKSSKFDSAPHTPLLDGIESYDTHYSVWLNDDGTLGSLADQLLNDDAVGNDIRRYELSERGRFSLKNIDKLLSVSEFAKKFIAANLQKIASIDRPPVSAADKIIQPGCWEAFETDHRTYFLTTLENGTLRALIPLALNYRTSDDYRPRFGRTVIRGDLWKGFHQDMGNVAKEGGVAFPNGKKPVRLVKQLIKWASTTPDGIVLDFFAGSGTSAQAVMELNLNDNGTRQFICVQMPEVIDVGSELYKDGYRSIAEVTRARIDNAISELKAEHPAKTTDLACAHFTLAPSNFKVWRGDVADAAALRETLSLFQSAEKSDNPPEDANAQTAMLAELLLKHGLGALGVHAISKPAQLAGVTVHRVLMHDDKQLWLCFEPYSSALKDEISKARPAQVVLLNSCFVGDKADELLSNLQLELAGLDIGLTVI